MVMTRYKECGDLTSSDVNRHRQQNNVGYERYMIGSKSVSRLGERTSMDESCRNRLPSNFQLCKGCGDAFEADIEVSDWRRPV